MKTTVLVGAALLALAAAPAWAQGSVSGTVNSTDPTSPGQQPAALPGAIIFLDGQAVAATDAASQFVLPAVAAGRHTLRITAVGHAALETNLTGQEAPRSLLFSLQVTSLLTGEALVTASRANDRTATVYTNLTRQDLAKRNFGQDLPYLLDQTPSVVVNSDAGAGVGYTDIRIRGTSSTGINTTVNGIPLNDPESHGSFLVNLPDLASSINSLQVQRGVGTSQNGSAAFGASVNISTLANHREAYGESQNSYGSFNTWKNNVSFGTGLVGGHFTFDGRLSRISSDGYMNWAASDLKSYYFAAGYQAKNTQLKFITFSGREKTYQAWNGVPEPALTGDAAQLQLYVANGAITAADAARVPVEGRRYSYYTYDNQTDNYQQNHYQLHLAQELGPDWNLAAALHLTRGFGYYESYRLNRRFSTYGLPNVVVGTTNPVTISRTNLIDRKWLDNYFYGGTFALSYQPRANDRLQATLGGGWNKFDNDHYGEILWAQYASTSAINQRYYLNTGRKTDYNAYLRATYQALPWLGFYGDVQLRHLTYTIEGNEVKGSAPASSVAADATYTFFNPKAGLTASLGHGQQLYASVAVGGREPVRADFTDRPVGAPAPQAERLVDYEAGYKWLPGGQPRPGDAASPRPAEQVQVNLYYMDYRNQLVPTGQLNDVGTALRANIASSYRAGIELSAQTARLPHFNLSGSLTLSRNRLREFTETLYAYNALGAASTLETTYRQAPLTLSPDVVAAATVEYLPVPTLAVALLGKAVGRQYLDNTGSAQRQLAPYQVADLRLRYTLLAGRAASADASYRPGIELALLVSNLFNKEYVANGYTYGNYDSASGQRLSFNFYYPQATRNYLASVNVRF